MAKREALGLMPCPECGFRDAEIKAQKCGVRLYRYCQECNAQFFARTAQQEKAMRSRVAAAPPEPEKVPEVKEAPKPAPEKAPEPKPAPKRGSLADALGFLVGGGE